VPGPASNHFLIDGFASANGQVCALFARRRLRMHPPDFSNSAYMISVPLCEVEAGGAGTARDSRGNPVSRHFQRRIQARRTRRDLQDPRINPRIWVYVEFAGRCGVDVCTMAYRDALGLPLGDVAVLPQRRTVGVTVR
jgi:predicted ATP-grasp superfamily ATP-dependent carboligase